MSAPNAGRQSPSEDRQTGAQQQDVPGSGRVGRDNYPSQPSDDYAQKSSEKTKQTGLQSNPEHPLDRVEQEKLK
jgi:hypothetical protein